MAADITIIINQGGERHEFVTPAGENLLKALRGHGVHLSAPCGGQGTCGKCAVRAPGGALEVTELDKARFSARELSEGWRLACAAAPPDNAELYIADDFAMDILTSYEKKPQDIGRRRFEVIELDLTENKKSVLAAVQSKTGRTANYRTLKKLSEIINGEGSALRDKNPVYLLADEAEVIGVFAEPPAEAFGAAVDIGTTTVAMELYNVLTMEKISSYSAVNSQKSFGADVITRIMAANNGHLAELHAAITHEINAGLKRMCEDAGIPPASLLRVAATGNTTMLHLFLNVPCESLGHTPFLPTFTETVTLLPSDCPFAGFACKTTVLPGASAYVGSDITAGVRFCGGLENDKYSLLIDLGTNGEMALYSAKGVLCASTAAGPAFEGGNISRGMGGTEGAVAKAVWQDGAFRVSTIGGKRPVGICGSGVLDIAAELIRNGLVDETGLLDEDIFEDDVPVCPEEGISFTQKDVREFQLAKSAVRSGIEVLIDEAAISYNDIDNVFLAGGFGHKLNLESAAVAGLFPPELKNRVKAVGNSSLGGCAMALSDAEALQTIESISERAREVSLSDDKRFAALFMEHMIMEKP